MVAFWLKLYNFACYALWVASNSRHTVWKRDFELYIIYITSN